MPQVRLYQRTIIEKALFANTLVSLPTGLGKTFIAAVVMWNYYRWFPTGKIVFMAPTKPLVTQQIEACHNIVGMPSHDTAQLMGTIHATVRAQYWQEKRVFFCTPQSLQNDLESGGADADNIVLLVVDEAHRATGSYAYCKAIKVLRARHGHFRVLALSATPGSTLQKVQDVIQNLLISAVEVRFRDHPEVKPYVQYTTIEKVTIPASPELQAFKKQFRALLALPLARLCRCGAFPHVKPTTVTRFHMVQGYQDAMALMQRGEGPYQMRAMVMELFAICISILHADSLLMGHGTRASYEKMLALAECCREKGSQERLQVCA